MSVRLLCPNVLDMHLPYPSVRECYLIETAIASVQLLALLVMAWRIRRRAPAPVWTPAVSVIVPCKGARPERLRNLRSILAQRYQGPVEFLLVAHDREDPAFTDIEQAAAENADKRVRVLFCDANSGKCADKNLKMIHAAGVSDARSEVLVFSEDKHRAPDGWLAALVSGLHPDSVGVASSLPLAFPGSGNAADLLFSIWCLVTIPYFYVCPWVIAASFAVRRRDFEGWKVTECWQRAVTDDNIMTVLAWRNGKAIAPVIDASGLIDRRLSLRQVISITTRCMFDMRFFTPWAWLGAAAVAAAKLIVLGRALWPVARPDLLALIVVCETGFAAGIVWLAARRFPLWAENWSRQWRPIWVWAVLAAPIVWALYCVNFVLSGISRQTYWTGIRYRVRGPYDVKVC
jgi:glycosyltransferase involved in cell wall biosynthesis